MTASFQIFFDGAAAEAALYDAIASLEVEENADLPGAFQLTVPVTRTDDSDLTFADDARFAPFAAIAVVATADGGSPECIFDGVVLASKLHLERAATASSLVVSGEDASWLMNLEETVREWVDVTDADVASTIFGEYGVTPADANSAGDSPTHSEDNHSLMQRATDAAFLRGLAQRSGKLFRVAGGSAPDARIGYFARPQLDGAAVVTLDLADPERWSVDALDFAWDVTRPTKVKARQASFTDDSEDGFGGETTDGGLPPLAEQTLASFAGRDTTVLLTAIVDDQGELDLRAQGALIDGGFFARCEGASDVARLGAVLRVGQVVAIAGAGATRSGNWLVWTVRHRISREAHRMSFTLVRNAMGSA